MRLILLAFLMLGLSACYGERPEERDDAPHYVPHLY